MDYTKDAILVHEVLGSLEEDENDAGDRESSFETHHPQNQHHQSQNQFNIFSIVTLSNDSELIGKKTITENDLSGVIKGNGSLSPASAPSSAFSPSLPSPTMSSLSPVLLDGQDFIDYNDTLDYIPMSMRPETYIVPVLFAIIFIIGVIGNGTLIVIFIKHRFMRNVPNMFIVSLAIGDLLLILFCVPFTSTLYTLDSWPYGLVVCKFSEFIKDLSVGVSVFTLTALSADRYFAIVDPMRKLTGRRATRITIISIAGIWALSILVALPSALFSYIRVFPEGEEDYDDESDGRTFQVCYPYPTEFGKIYAKVMVMFHFLVYFFIPLCFIATFYIIMARHLVLSTRNMPGEAQGQVKQIQARKKVANMVLSFVCLFAICFFPHHLFLLWFYFYPDSENSFNAFWNICRIVGFCLSFMNSCINPITLYCVSGTFRKQYNDHLFCCFCDKTGGRPVRGGHYSLGGTLAGGGGNGGNGGGLCAACVSLSGNNGNLNGNDSRYGNGTGGRSGHGRMHRGSTWENSDRMMSKRKSTWETQTTVVNHRVVNLSGAVNGSANIHINLCSEHEHIPLRNLSKRQSSLRPTSVNFNAVQQSASCSSPQGCATTAAFSNQAEENGTAIKYVNKSQDHRKHQHCFSSSKTNLHQQQKQPDCHLHGHGRQNRRGLCAKEENDLQNQLSPNYPSRIEEETSGSGGPMSIEQDEPNSGTSQKSISVSKERQSSPSKSLAKVGEILSKISGNYRGPSCISPTKKSTNSETCSSPSRKNFRDSIGEDYDNEEDKNSISPTPTNHVLQMNYKNNNDYTGRRRTRANGDVGNSLGIRDKDKNTPESGEDEYTVTSFISVPDTIAPPLGSNLEKTGKVIICYN